MTAEEIRGALQAILFVAGEPVSLEQLSDALGGQAKETIEAELEGLRASFEQSTSGMVLERTAGGYRFATRPAFDPYLRKFFAKQNEARLSMAGLETLAIVAYRQPITAPEINEIRGVNSSGVLRTLLDRRMVRIAGRKPVVGSPFLYRTTKEFLVHFGLNTIQDLPRLEEFSEMLGVNLPEELVLPDEIPMEDDRPEGAAASDVFDQPATSTDDSPEQRDERALSERTENDEVEQDTVSREVDSGRVADKPDGEGQEDIDDRDNEVGDAAGGYASGDSAGVDDPHSGSVEIRADDVNPGTGAASESAPDDVERSEVERKPVESLANDQD